MRPLSYPDTNIVVLCYAINSPASYENINFKWIPELRKHLPEIPILLVATKVDLREDDAAMQALTDRNLLAIT